MNFADAYLSYWFSNGICPCGDSLVTLEDAARCWNAGHYVDKKLAPSEG